MRDATRVGRPRSIAKLALLGAVLGLLAAVTPWFTPTASANLNTPIPADANGDPADQFFDTDALFVLTLSDFRGGSVCVVPESVLSPEGGCKAKKAPWSTPNRILGIGTVYSLIEGPTLRVGTWRLLSEDSAGNGQFVGETFTVSPCTPDAGCDPTIGAAAAAAFKAGVDDMRTGSDVACLALKLKDLKDDPVKNGGRALDKVPGIEAKSYEAGGFGASFIVTPFGGAFSFAIPDFSNPGEAKAMEILQELTCSLRQMYKDIQEDPPDPGFATVFEPVFSTVGDLGDPASTALAVSLDRQRAYARALLRAYERYQGAQVAANQAGQIRQADAIARFGDLLEIELGVSSQLLTDWATRIDGLSAYAGPVFDDAAAKADLAAAYARVRTSGFTADELAQLATLGADTPAEIAAVRGGFSDDLGPLAVGETLQDRLRLYSTQNEAVRVSVRAFSNDAAAAAARLEGAVANTPPTASFIRNPQTGPAPLDVAFDASSSSDPEGPLASYAWNFGDGATGTGVTASHTYTAVGNYIATLTVTDAGGLPATTTRTVTVTNAPNTPPTAAFSATPTTGPAPLAVSFDASASSDTQGPISSYSWTFGDGGTATGVGTNHTYAQGTYVATLTVTDSGGLTASTTRTIAVGSTENVPPTAVAVATTPPTGLAPLTVSFSGAGSSDPEGPLTYALGLR